MGKKKLSDEDRAEILRLKEEAGYSLAALANRFDVSYQTIYRVCNPEKYKEAKKKHLEYRKRNPLSYQERKERARRYDFSLSRSVDGEMIAYLDQKENLSDYLKTLIREDMKKVRQ